MDAAKIFEGIALLIDLAQRGEINPWDVQVIEVIDRYLSEIFTASEVQQGTYEADLSQSGQAFLSASLLVLFKANTLIALESPITELEPAEDSFLSMAEDTAHTSLRLPLEQQIRRRPAALPPQKRRVTLQELIEQLQLIANQIQLSSAANPSTTTRTRRLNSQSRTSARAALALAHQENLTEVAGELEQFLTRYSQQILEREQDWLNLDQLVELWTKTKQVASMASTLNADQATASFEDVLPAQLAEGEDSHSHRVSVFWALLLLSAQSKVELSQEEFYQEIKIRTLYSSNNSAMTDTDTTATALSY